MKKPEDDMNERIAQVIAKLGIKKIDFAKTLNISSPFVSELCTGAKKASDRTIADICREFKVNENWLRKGEGDMFVQTEEDSIKRLCADLHATNLDAEIIRVYFKIDEQIRGSFMRQLLEQVQASASIPTSSNITTRMEELERKNLELIRQNRDFAARLAVLEQEDELQNPWSDSDAG